MNFRPALRVQRQRSPHPERLIIRMSQHSQQNRSWFSFYFFHVCPTPTFLFIYYISAHFVLSTAGHSKQSDLPLYIILTGVKNLMFADF